MHTNSLPKTLPAFFWHFIKKQPVAFTLLFIAPMAVILEANVIPYCLKIIIDGLSGQGDKAEIIQKIVPALWFAGGSWLSLIVIFRLQNMFQGYVIPKFEADIRMSVVNYLTEHSHSYFANQLSGSLANKVSDLPKAIEGIRNIICWNVVATLSVVMTSIILMSKTSPLFSIILVLWVVVHLVMTLIAARFVYRASSQNAEDKSSLSGAIVDTLSNIIPTKLFAQKAHEMGYIGSKQRVENISNKRLIISMNNLRLFMDIPVTIMLFSIMYFLITGWIDGNVTAGDVVFIFNTFWAITFWMWMLGHALTDLFRDVGIAKQALSIITPPHEITDIADAKLLVVKNGEIVFDDVTFNYKKNNNLFQNKNVQIKAGSKVGLVGFSGSGKTTFVNLILRFFDVESGRILIDGQNIAKVTQDSLHENISMIPQDTSLFHRSLMENIRYGKIDASDEEVIAASKRSHCDEFISQIPEGYNALVGERGVKLSGGQRQRIAIARAMLKNAPILILDEATSALDSVTEKHIQSGLHELMQNRTTIVIAHRLSTLSEMDRILVFDKGHVIEDGTHEELLKSGGHYAHMWKMQAGGFLPEHSVS